jgi:hypothetical protein
VVELDVIDAPHDAAERLSRVQGVESAAQNENILKVLTSRERGFQSVLDASLGVGLKLRNATVSQPTLEDVFLHYTGRAMIDEVKNKVPMKRHGPWRRTSSSRTR